jgi:Tol biopolymer transport system component
MGRGQIYEVSINSNSSSGGQMNLSNDRWDNYDPRLSPDGTQILFASNRNGKRDLFVMNADAAANGTGGSATQLTHGGNNSPWNPD